MKRIYCFFVLGLCLLCACSGNRQVTEQLDRAEALLEAAHPDSAWALLDSLDTPDRWSERPFARWCMLYCRAADKLYKDMLYTEQLTRAWDWYKRHGSAEETFGHVMKSSFMPYRDEMFISTKAGHDMWTGPYGTWNSRKHLMASLDQSLKRMNLDYVDVFYSHRYDPETPLEETMQALVDIVRQGKALYVGLSKYPVEAADRAYAYLKAHDVPCLLYQGRYSMLVRDPEKQGVLTQAKANGVGFIAFSPLAEGLLTNRYLNGIPEDSRIARGGHLKKEALTDKVLHQIQVLNALALRRGQTLAEMALAWLLKDELVTSVIIGASSVGQLDDNLKALGNTCFSEEELREIEAVLVG